MSPFEQMQVATEAQVASFPDYSVRVTVTDEMVKRAADAFVRSANHEVRHKDIRAALKAALGETN